MTRLVVIILAVLVAALLVSSSAATDSASSRAKRAAVAVAAAEVDKVPVSALEDSSLVLVPIVDQTKTRRQRREAENKKYRRLAHSLDVQSDIRFRCVVRIVGIGRFS